MNGLHAEIRRLAMLVDDWTGRIDKYRMYCYDNRGADHVVDPATMQELLKVRQWWEDALTARVLQHMGIRNTRGVILTTTAGRRDPHLAAYNMRY